MSYKSIKSILNSIVLLGLSTNIIAQEDSIRTIVLNSVFITEKKPSFNTTSREIVAITNTEMKEKGAQTLSEAISAFPA